MKAKSHFGIRLQVLLLEVVPLFFLVLTLVLVMLLVQGSERFAALSLRAAQVHRQSDQLTESFERMSRSLSDFAKSHRPADLAGFDAAQKLISGQEVALENSVRGDRILEPAATRYLKDVRAVVTLFSAGRNELQAGHMRELLLMMASPKSKALGVEFDKAKTAFSVIAATDVFIVSSAWQRSIANLEHALLICTSLGVFCTIVLAGLFGMRLVRRLETLASNARRLSAGEAPVALPGFDEITALDGVYRSMFEATVAVNRELDGLREAERLAKVRLETTVRAYGELAAQVAGGNLSERVVVDNPDDELGQLGSGLNQMAASLEGLVDEMQAAASSLASAASEILAATSQQLSSATEEATAVRQTAVTVLEVRQTAEVAARKTKLVSELAQRVEQIAASGRESVEESVRSSEGAKERMEVLGERILAFSDQAQAIAEINAAVATLAEQSNLLAVNAGIEAAKAGDAGRGFAVVAAEVKELGASSKEATVQVRRIVVDIQRIAQNAVIAAEQGMKAAENGTAIAQRSGEAMDFLTASISEASEAAQQINASAEQQQAGMDQIALAMQQIEQASVQTVAATQQVESAANDLSQLAQKLASTIGAAHI
jgi:methyl-accepting chemotaxis protein